MYYNATEPMNLADPELELVDPTPNVHALFVHFDKIFFWEKLASRTAVRWSKRMYSAAGVCSYQTRSRFCDIALSEPLLKLRPRKNLIETLLHEMIHAFLFLTGKDVDRDGHGPNFRSHMYRINRATGLNITIYHDFHDEVELYQTHWWRCNGPCQMMKPRFGIVRRSSNRAPGPNDYWWREHTMVCGGTFIKIKEPPRQTRKPVVVKNNNADITKYIQNVQVPNNNFTGAIPGVVGQKSLNPTLPHPPPSQVVIFNGTAVTLHQVPLTQLKNVTDHIRSIWAKKKIPALPTTTAANRTVTSTKLPGSGSSAGSSRPNKSKAEPIRDSPPAKIKKFDDSKAKAILNDLYGDNLKLTQPHNNSKLVAVNVQKKLVNCPICNNKIDIKEINSHIDECLNKDIIKKLTEEEPAVHQVNPNQTNIQGNPNLQNQQVNSGQSTADKPVTENKQNTKDEVALDLTTSINAIDNDETKKLDSLENTKPTPIQCDEIINLANEDSEAKNQGTEEPATGQQCPCCGEKVDKPIEQHLDDCLAFFGNNTTIPEEGASTSSTLNDSTVIIDDDEIDQFDETQLLNATGTKSPCPCCMEMVEMAIMNDHLDVCLGIK